MKANAKTFASALRLVKAATDKRSPIDARKAVKITALSGVLTLEASNGSFGVRHILADLEGIDDLTALVDAERLGKSLGVMKGDVTLAQGEGSSLIVSTGPRKVTIPSERMEDFHVFPYASGDAILVAHGPDVAEALARTIPFASKDDTRPVLTGVAVDTTGNLVATDSYRLCVIPCGGIDRPVVKAIGSCNRTVNIPAKVWALAARTMKGSARVAVAGPMVTIDTGDTVWTARLIDGIYPNWEQLIPDKFSVTVTPDVDTFRESADAALKVLKKSSPMRVGLSDDGLTVRACEPDGVDMAERVPATVEYHEEWSGDIGLNPEYVSDALRSLDGAPVTLSMISPLRPALFESDKGRALIMPIRLDA